MERWVLGGVGLVGDPQQRVAGGDLRRVASTELQSKALKGMLLMIEILHDFVYRHHENCGTIASIVGVMHFLHCRHSY